MKTITTLLLLAIALPAAAQSKIDTAKYDKQVIRIIKRNANLRRSPHRVDSILAQTRRLPFVTDCAWDGCWDKILIYPGHLTYGVVMNIKGQTIERCYNMRSSKRKHRGLPTPYFTIKEKWDDNTLDYSSAGNCPGFIVASRESCNQKK